MPTAEPVPDVRGELLESPVWDDRRGLLWLVDIVGRVVLGVDPDAGPGRTIVRRLPMPSEPGCVALASDGALVVALRDRVARVDAESGALATLAIADHDPATTRFNDGRCDFRGRFWVGSMYEPRDKAAAKLYRLEDGQLVTMAEGITLANGLAFDPDGRGGRHADSPTRIVWRFDLDTAGALTERRPWLTLGADARPDGATMDAEGGYWLCAIDAGEIRRYRPDGAMDRKIAVPTPWPTMPAFGGRDMKSMFVTSLRVGRPPEKLAAAPLSGCLFRIRGDLTGVPEPRVIL